MADTERRLNTLETEVALANQSRKHIHIQLETLESKVDIVCSKIDSFITATQENKTNIALVNKDIGSLGVRINKLENNHQWAIRTGISGLLSGLIALTTLIWRLLFHKI